MGPVLIDVVQQVSTAVMKALFIVFLFGGKMIKFRSLLVFSVAASVHRLTLV